MNRLMFLFYQTPGRKSIGFLYNTKKVIHPPQTKGARDHESPYVSILPNPGAEGQALSKISPITFREYMGYINTKKYLQMKGKSGAAK